MKLLKTAGVSVLADNFEDAQKVFEAEKRSFIFVPGQLRLNIIEQLYVFLNPRFNLIHGLKSWFTTKVEVVTCLGLTSRQGVVIVRWPIWGCMLLLH